MNYIYRLVWSRVANSWVAVAETARGKGKTKSRTIKLAVKLTVAALFATAASFSLPLLTYAANAVDATVVGGQGSVKTAGNTTTINQASQRLAVDWVGLSTAAGEALVFNQPNTQAIALNRITGSSPSTLLGSLRANGQVYILNPNGVLFGAGAQVNVGGLVASTLTMDPNDFMNGGSTFAKDPNASGMVENRGTLTAANGGYIALLSGTVRNEGTIDASQGTALLAAGDKVTLDVNNGSLIGYTVDQGDLNALIENKQLIRADGGRVIMVAKALDKLSSAVINNTGIIEARTAQNQNGHILLLSDMDVGTVNVGGALDASAPTTGDGGFIETSAAHVRVTAGTRVTTAAANGETGKWLIDPNDFTIAATGGDMDAATVASNLANTNFEIATATMGTAGGNGDINVNQAVSWGSANALTLTAQRNININQSITAANGGLVLNAGSGISAPAALDVALFDLRSGTWRQVSGTLPTFTANDFRISGGTFIRALGGDGGNTPYQIADIYGLQGLNSTGMFVNNYQLANNIDASGTIGWNNGNGFSPIGYGINYFIGTLDGLGHTINNLTIYLPNGYNVGLFGSLGSPFLPNVPAMISNVGLVGGSVTGFSSVGALAGAATYAAIANSYASTTVVGATVDSFAVGGLVGTAAGVNLASSYATGDVTGGSRVGGLVGDFMDGRILDSYASGNVTGSYAVGGLAGQYSSGFTGDFGAFGVVRSHATGNVNGNIAAGGLIGYTEITNSDLLSNLYATGEVSGGTEVGGLIGWHHGGQLSTAYATGNVTATGDSAGGLIGQFDMYGAPGFIDTVHASGNVTGVNKVGGLVGGVGFTGSGTAGSIYGVYATGKATGVSHVGGLVGELISGDVRVSYSSGDVSGADGIGGLVGYNQNSISSSYASGNVTGTGNVGGLVGINPGVLIGSYATGSVTGLMAGGLIGSNSGIVAASFWNTTSTGIGIGVGSGSSSGIVGIDNAAASSLATYANAGWDIGATGGTSTIWRIYEGQTGPLLRPLLTQIMVTADATSKTYDGATSTASTYSTSINGAALDGSLYYVTSKNVGAYSTASTTLTQTGLYSGQQGYDIRYANASLTIDKADVTLSTSNVTKTYDGTTAATGTVVATVGSIFAGDSISGGSFSFTDKNAGIGDKVVTTSGATVGDGVNNSNYNITYANNTTSTINKANLSVTANAVDKVYDGLTAAGLTYADNRIAGDILNFTGTANFTDKNVGNGKAITVGSISLGGADAGNYNLLITSGTSADITPASLTVTADSGNKFYDGQAYTGNNGATINGLVGGDTLADLLGTLNYGGSSQGATGIGNYVITPGGLNSGNYRISFVDGVLSIKALSQASAALGGATLEQSYNGVRNTIADIGDGEGQGNPAEKNGKAVVPPIVAVNSNGSGTPAPGQVTPRLSLAGCGMSMPAGGGC
jgi:filamentous hemagglutinin family protein